MRHFKSPLLRMACWVGVWLAVGRAVHAQDGPIGLIQLDPPGAHEFVRDLAHLLRPADQQKIKQIGEQLLTDKKTPIIVVTINSMAEHGGARMRIDTFSLLLFNQWGIGSAKLNGEDWNTGILLLVSKGDRKARIELGRYWRRDNDLQCQQIMEQTILPKFRAGEFSGGILAGVESLDKMARGLQVPHSAAAMHRNVAPPVNRPAVTNQPAPRPMPHQYQYPQTYHYTPPQRSGGILPFIVLVIVIAGILFLIVGLAGTSIFNAQRRLRSGNYYGNDYFGNGLYFGGHWGGPTWWGNPGGFGGSQHSDSGFSGGGFSSGGFSGGDSGGGSFGGSSGGAFDGGSSGGGGATGSW